MTVRIPVLALISTILFNSNVLAGDKQIEPHELMRSWQLVQDDIVRGNRKSFASQRKLIAAISRRFDSFPPEIWSSEKNLRAAVLLGLSGGASTVLRRLAREHKLPESFRLLGPAAIAVSARRRREAWHFLSRVDARDAHPVLAPHVALVKGKLLAKEKPRDAFTQFNEARLLAPGTLIEEAALRQQIALAPSAGFPNDVAYLSRAYVRRFPHSPYLGRFLRIFSSAMVSQWSEPDQMNFERIDSVVQMLPSKLRHAVLVDIARLGVQSGKHQIVRAATKSVSDEAISNDGVIYERARLYGAASSVVTQDYETAVANTLEVKAKSLNPEDRKLRNAVLTLARLIRRWPDPDLKATDPIEDKKAKQPFALQEPVATVPEPDAARDAIKKARSAIAATHNVIEGKIQ